ncbi:GLUT4 regulating protein TUG-domain-containing protein [Apodospora peruviana]|uniref:GLUT4 regulating protein TUG-domain-containing protein n=1 Tax=Apodospora peruviana TaxID=516989 RepID=A0AAE0IQP0_9PEZI|nr:GLUT4 regulating protein TUG-domain-containing protein [Apodospora peruviana]
MAAHVEVVSTDLRRVKIKVTPGTYLVDVLGEACKKLNLNDDNYQFKHKQKIVDLSGPFRTSGLSPGAKLELVRKSTSPSVINIALDVNGRRLTKKLPNDMTLWQVMRQFETGEKDVNITGRASPKITDGSQSGSGQLYYEAPVFNIMGRDYTALEDLQKTLSQCGVNSGSIALRVSFLSTDKSLYDAMNEIGQYLDGVEPRQTKPNDSGVASQSAGAMTAPTVAAAPAAEEAKREDAPIQEATDAGATVSATDKADTPNTAPPAESNEVGDLMDIDQPPSTTTPADGHLQLTSVFSAPTSSTPAATRVRVEDSVYEPTIAHAQLRQQQLLARAQNTRLKSDEELAAEAAQEAEKLAKITKVEVKVRFPDQTSAQWDIHPANTGATLYAAIRDIMLYPSQPFKLVMSVTKITIQERSDKRLVADYRLKGRELLNLVWEDAASEEARKAPFLKSSVASRAQAIVVPDVPESVPNIDESSAAGSAAAASSSKPVKSDKSGSHMDSEALKKKLGKFLKLPGKK